MIRLCQKFRAQLQKDISAELNQTPCSLCAHPLSAHAPVKQEDLSWPLNKKPLLGQYHGITLKASTVLSSFSPSSPESLNLLIPTSLNETFVLVSVGKFQDSEEFRLAVLCHRIEEVVEPLIKQEECFGEEGVEKRGKRKRVAPEVGTRRSMRLATKKARREEEQVRKQLKGLKGIGRHPLHAAYESEEDVDDNEDELSEVDYRRLAKASSEFVNSLNERSRYQSFSLPQVSV